MPSEKTLAMKLPTGLDDLLRAVGRLLEREFLVCPCCGATFERHGDNAMADAHLPGCELAAVGRAAWKVSGVEIGPGQTTGEVDAQAVQPIASGGGSDAPPL